MGEEAAATGFIDLLTFGAQAGYNAWQSKKDREWQEEMAAKDRAWQEEMYGRAYEDQVALIDKQNEYNLPANQMKRLKDAGINPLYAISGNLQNVSAGGSTPSVPSGRSFQYKSKEADLIQAIGVSNAYKEGKVLSRQADYLAAQAKKERELADGVALDNDKKRSEQPYWSQMAENAFQLANANLSEVNQRVQHSKKQVELLVENIEQAKWYNEYIKSLEPELRAQVEQSTRRLKATADIEEYRNSMKEVNQWVGVGTEVVGVVLQGLGLYFNRGRGIPFNRGGGDYNNPSVPNP